jgi:hypothetical protein
MTMSAELSAVSRASQQRVPDFFIVGHHKCGTTALYAMLRLHPQIYMPPLKEPRFFATDLRYSEPARHHIPAQALPQTFEQYMALFDPAGPEQRVGEASPMYLWSREAARHIANAQPGARIVAILREPASFLHSLHNHWVRHHVETEKDFRTALSLEELRRRRPDVGGGSYWPQALLYSDHVRYVEQLRRYHDLFPAEQVLVLIYDDFRADNEATVRRVLRFLDVDDTLPVQAIERNPTTVGVRAMRLDDLIRRMYAGSSPGLRAVKAGLTAVSTAGARRKAMRTVRRRFVYSKPQALDQGLALELRRRFRGEVTALSEYLDRDLLGLWGYERLD